MNQEQLHYRVTGDAKGFKGAINQSQKSLNGFQQQIKSAASSLKLLLVGGLTVAGAQGLRSAKQLDQSMTRIKSLVGIAGDEVDRMGKTAIQMASNTGQSANDAAEALFFITSAGLRGSEAMEVLEASLKAAAIGLGETKTVADLATSALNAYGVENLSATEATDVLVSAVREGKLEASELSDSMGRVLPIASQLGVEFHEVGGAFAAMSRTGTNAAEASTAIKGIFLGLIKPTQQGREELKKMNLSYEGLRKQLKEEGLLSLLETLKINFEGNVEAQQNVFSNSRALVGVMDLLGKGIDSTRIIMDNMSRSTGALNDGFIIVEESISQKLDKSFAKLRNNTLPFFLNILFGTTEALNGFVSVLKFLGDVGGPSGDLKRQIDANTKSLIQFTKSGKEASEEMKKLFALANVKYFLGVGDDTQTPDLLLANILSNQGDKPAATKGFDTLLEFNKQFGTSFKELAEITNEVQFELFLLNDTANLLSTSTRGMAENLDIGKLKMLDFKNVVTDTAQAQKQFALIANAVTFGMNLFFDALSNPEGFSTFIKGIQKMIGQLLKQLAIMAAISAIASALGFGSFKSIFGMLSGFGGGDNKGGGGGLLSGIMPFAKGGIVTSPVTGLIGEQGAEAIIPLDRLPQLMQASQGKQVGEFTLKGQDLILALERSGDFRARVTG